jgi:hypothetical protein
MKLFIPMPDETTQELSGHLVPFNPDFLGQDGRPKEGRKPSNWVADNDFTSACERLRMNQQRNVRAAI